VAGGSVLGSIANGTFDGTTTPFSIAFVVYVSCAAALIVLVGTRGRGAVGAANVA
jgi:hypothetical protein